MFSEPNCKIYYGFEDSENFSYDLVFGTQFRIENRCNADVEITII